MLTSYSSNAIAVKARAIYGKRLKTTDYHELLRLRTVSDIAAYLKATSSYTTALSGILETQIHRGQLENLVSRERMNRFVRLCHYDFSAQNGFYRYIVIDLEISILLHAITLLNSKSPQDIILELPMFMKEYICFDLMRLSNIQNFDDLLIVLSGTPYRNLLKRFSEENGRINLSECEHELKCYYYKTVLELIDQYYRGKTRQELREVILIEAELINLALIYRMKTFFKRPAEKIQMLLLPYHYKLTPRMLDELLATQSEAEFVERMRLSRYSARINDEHFDYLEGYTKRLSYLLNRKLICFSTSAPVAFFALMTLSKIEQENITAIIEGIRYQIPSMEIEKLLILE